MIQCEQCEHFHRQDSGEISFTCDPFGSVKEPECLTKWQLIKINQMVATHQATLDYYRKLAPMQEKMFKVVEREIDEMNEGEKWKVDDEDDHDDQDDHEKFSNDWPGDEVL